MKGLVTPRESRISRRITQRQKKREKQKELAREEQRDKLFEILSHRRVNSHKNILFRQYGFRVNPSLPTWANIQNILLQTPSNSYFHCPNNKAIHLLINRNSEKHLPPGTAQLLGLSLNFNIKTPFPSNNIKATIERFKRDIHREFVFKNNQDDGAYIKKLYLPNESWNPANASDEIEERLVAFEALLLKEHHRYQ